MEGQRNLVTILCCGSFLLILFAVTTILTSFFFDTIRNNMYLVYTLCFSIATIISGAVLLIFYLCFPNFFNENQKWISIIALLASGLLIQYFSSFAYFEPSNVTCRRGIYAFSMKTKKLDFNETHFYDSQLQFALKMSQDSRILWHLDGYSGSGKSTFAYKLFIERKKLMLPTIYVSVTKETGDEAILEATGCSTIQMFFQESAGIATGTDNILLLIIDNMQEDLKRDSWKELKHFYADFKDRIVNKEINVIYISSENSIERELSQLSGYGTKLKTYQLMPPPKENITSFYQKELGLEYKDASNLTDIIGLDYDRAIDIRKSYIDRKVNLNEWVEQHVQELEGKLRRNLGEKMMDKLIKVCGKDPNDWHFESEEMQSLEKNNVVVQKTYYMNTKENPRIDYHDKFVEYTFKVICKRNQGSNTTK